MQIFLITNLHSSGCYGNQYNKHQTNSGGPFSKYTRGKVGNGASARANCVYDVFIAGLTSVGYILNFLFLWLLIIQIRQISKGQTKYELKKGITTYSIGLKKILREIGGKYWFLVWISPLVVQESNIYNSAIQLKFRCLI
jgi:hypothetical protein